MKITDIKQVIQEGLVLQLFFYRFGKNNRKNERG